MTRQDIIDKVRALNLPAGSYIVFGSGPLAAAGLRESQDIDLFVSPEQLERFRQAGWQPARHDDEDLLANDVFEAHYTWDRGNYRPTLQQLLATADVIDGIPFASLHEVRQWKQAAARPKDLRDIELIDNYLAKQHRQN